MLRALGFAACLLAAPASAAALPEAATRQLAVSDKLIIHNRDVPRLTVYEWERGGTRYNAWPGDGATPPADAAKLQVKIFTFPTGALRELIFLPGTRTPSHENFSDILIYSAGGRQVQYVDKQVIPDHVGDVTFHPTGVFHRSETFEQGLRAEFAFAPGHRSGTQAIALTRAATPLVTRGRGASRRQVRDFSFPGYRLLEVHLGAGHGEQASAAAQEKLVYVLKGRLHLTTGGVSDTVVAGDIFRIVRGRAFSVAASEDSVLLEADASRPPPE